jgi:hypothetical protein
LPWRLPWRVSVGLVLPQSAQYPKCPKMQFLHQTPHS